MRRLVRGLAIALTLSATACGGDSSDQTEAGGGATGIETAATGVTGPTAATGDEGCVDLTGEGPVFTIRLHQIAFVPDCITASASQGISVVNEDPVLHSFTLEGTPIDVDIEADATFNGEPITGVVAPGTYELVCKYHAAMIGEVTVVE